MAKNLLNDADVNTLLDQQGRRRVPGIVDPGVPDLGPAEDGLPGAPVLGAFDRAAAAVANTQIMIRPPVTRLQPLCGLLLAMLPEQLQQRGRALERELALPFALPKDEATANSIGALIGVPSAVRWTWALVTDVALSRAARFASRKVPMLLTVWLAGLPVPLLTTCMRISTSMPPLNALNLEPRSYNTGFQVHIRPAESKGLTLTDS